nr:nuclear transport factor 2 family protein [Flavobacterium piscinae]
MTEANFDNYFDLMTEDAVFIGTDAAENWNRKILKLFQNLILIKVKHGLFSH